MLIWFALLIIIFYFASPGTKRHNIRNGSNQYRHNSSPEPDSALEILKKRYATGELTLEDYRAMAEEIRGG
ncbi:MAG: hypothetical protein FH756_04510 [Firmicutes bacterium]|nr:hypothetical protein [Bacillota bacterium]